MTKIPAPRDGQLLGVLYGANPDRMARGARHAADVAAHEEGRRLALDLNDTVGAMLSTLGAGIRQLGSEPWLDEGLRSRLSAIERQTTEATAALRDSVGTMRPSPERVAPEAALRGALREHCRAFSDRTGTIARMITLTELPKLPQLRVWALADAVREALLDAEEYAGAQSVIVSVFASRDGVAVTISDDGAALGDGAAPDGGANRRPGLGLAATSGRLARVGGSLTVEANDENDGGVTVRAWVPA
jgi:signal transduction histidine kinase